MNVDGRVSAESGKRVEFVWESADDPKSVFDKFTLSATFAGSFVQTFGTTRFPHWLANSKLSKLSASILR